MQAAVALNNVESEDREISQIAKELWRTYFSADARFRQESIFQDGSPSRYRYRIRFRMSGNFPIHPHANLGFRMVTGATDDPTTGNVDLDDYFSKKGFNLDRLFLRYSPSRLLTFTMGKFANPFKRVELVFHNDVQFEGIAQQLHVNDVGSIRQVQVNLGQFILAESKSGPDTNLFAGNCFLRDCISKGCRLVQCSMNIGMRTTSPKRLRTVGLLVGTRTRGLGPVPGRPPIYLGLELLSGLPNMNSKSD